VKISISGKGGSGKTTLAGTLARALARQGYSVMAIDGDSNPNLGITLGLSPEMAGKALELPDDLLKEVEQAGGEKTRVLTLTPEEIRSRYGTETADGVRLLSMKRIDHAGKG
jgi:CO dehydrogenase maturation factor